MITNDKPNVEEDLKKRIKLAMPLSQNTRNGLIYGALPSTEMKSNFIINEIALSHGEPSGAIDSINFNITFLSSYGVCTDAKWITGGVMNSIITYNFKKIQFVFDGTIHIQPSWKSHWHTLKHTPNRIMSDYLPELAE